MVLLVRTSEFYLSVKVPFLRCHFYTQMYTAALSFEGHLRVLAVFKNTSTSDCWTCLLQSETRQSQMSTISLGNKFFPLLLLSKSTIFSLTDVFPSCPISEIFSPEDPSVVLFSSIFFDPELSLALPINSLVFLLRQ